MNRLRRQSKRRTDHGFYQRGIGGEARQNLARARDLEKYRAEPRDMRIDRLGANRCHALADPDTKKKRWRWPRQNNGNNQQGQKIAVY